MGSGSSKKAISAATHPQSEALTSRVFRRSLSCICAPFSLQPHCLTNRHLHAFRQGTELIIVDLSFNKRITISDVFNPVQELQSPQKVAETVGLDVCNVIACQWDFAVIQVFHKEYTRFYVCDCSTGTVVATLTKTFDSMGLCECYITADKSVMLLKQNPFHWTSHMLRGITDFPKIEMFSLTKIPGQCQLMDCSADTLGADIAICPDPHKRRVYFAYISEVTEAPIVMGHNLNSSKPWHQCIHRPKKGFDTFLNVQITKPGSLIFLTLQGRRRSPGYAGSPAICCGTDVTVQVINKHSLEVLQTFESATLTRVPMFAPIISPSGRYVYLHGKLSSFIPTTSVKSLKTLCQELLTELTLPEDVHRLPIPKQLQKCVLYGLQMES